MAAQQPVAQQPDQRKHAKGEALHHQVQPRVFQAVANLLAGQVDPMQEKHHEDADIDDPLGVHGAAAGAKGRKEVRQQRGEQHAAEEPVGHYAFEVAEDVHRAPRVVRKVDLA